MDVADRVSFAYRGCRGEWSRIWPSRPFVVDPACPMARKARKTTLFSTRESRSSSRDCSACVRRAWPSSFSRMSTSSVNRGSPPASAFSRAMRSRKFIPASSHHCTFGCRHEASTRAANSDFARKNGIKWAALVYVGFSSMVRRCGHVRQSLCGMARG